MKINSFCRSSTIECISKDGEALGGEVDADLVGAAGVEGTF